MSPRRTRRFNLGDLRSESSFRRGQAFTLLEIVAVLLILTILSLLFVPNLAGYLRRAGEVRCSANMRAINIGLRGYLQDHKSVWPQGPSPLEEKAWEQFWLTSLAPYGISARDWRCPTINGAFAQAGTPDAKRPKVHYIPTLFSAEPDIANRWPTQPWLIERSDAHGSGPLICFPDGSVKSANRVLAEIGAR
jgi:type II secretory pathway pseudopilin PulG